MSFRWTLFPFHLLLAKVSFWYFPSAIFLEGGEIVCHICLFLAPLSKDIFTRHGIFHWFIFTEHWKYVMPLHYGLHCSRWEINNTVSLFSCSWKGPFSLAAFQIFFFINTVNNLIVMCLGVAFFVLILFVTCWGSFYLCVDTTHQIQKSFNHNFFSKNFFLSWSVSLSDILATHLWCHLIKLLRSLSLYSLFSLYLLSASVGSSSSSLNFLLHCSICCQSHLVKFSFFFF